MQYDVLFLRTPSIFSSSSCLKNVYRRLVATAVITVLKIDAASGSGMLSIFRSSAGGLVLTMMAGLAKFERELLRERQRRGIEAARQRGKHLGRPRLLTGDHADTAIRRLQTESLASIAGEWRVSERTLSRHVKKHAGDGPPPLRPGG